MTRLSVSTALVLGALPALLTGDEPRSPNDGVIQLFNGKDLTGLYTWLKDTKRDDPRKVFSVHDGLLHISGDGFGYLATEKEYRDYHLVVEYKWGKKTDGGKFVRNSGILLHAIGPDGGAGGTWMSSIECQLAQGCVGDLIVIRGKDAKQGDDPRATHQRSRARSRQAAALEKGRRAAGLHQRAALVVEPRSRLQGAARHPRQERRREPARRVDAGRVHLRRQADHGRSSTAPTSTSVTTFSRRPARSCCSPRGSSCSFASSNCTR